MNNPLKWLVKQESPQSAKSFAAFRIGFSVFLLVFIVHISYYRPLIFNTIPHLVYNPFPAKLFLVLWSLVVGSLMVGWQTRLVSVINYLFVIIITFLFSNTGSGSFNDDLLRIGSFLLIIMPADRHFAVDAMVKNIRFGVQNQKPTSSLYYVAALLVSLGLMYFASSVTKLYSPMWIKGLGLWIPASMPYNKWNNIDFFLNSEGLMKLVNYVTIAWEFLFIFILFSKKWKGLFAVLGVFFHLVLALLFPFPLLCFGPVPFYFLFIGDSFWARFQSKPIHISINSESHRQQFFARALQSVNRNTHVTYHNQSKLAINHTELRNNWETAISGLNQTALGKTYSWLFNIELFRLITMAFVDDGIYVTNAPVLLPALKSSFKRFWLSVFCILLLSVQLFYTSYHLVSKYKGTGFKTGERKNAYQIRRNITDLSLKPSNLFRTLFGLNARGVFLDHSNVGTKTVFAIVQINPGGDTTWLPFFGENGHTLSMNMNLAWSKYSFNSVCSGTIPNPHELEKTLWHWSEKAKVRRKNIEFHVLKRTYIYPGKFEIDYQKQQAHLPWSSQGIARWKDGHFSYQTTASTR